MAAVINPPMPFNKSLDDLNPDLAFSYELAEKFVDRTVPLSLEDTDLSYTEIQVGYTKRPAWFPYVSIHTADTDMSIETLGRGADLAARSLATDFAILIRDEASDEQLGRARLTDLKYDLMRVLGKMAGGGKTFRHLEIEKVELIGITPEDIEEAPSWAFSGQVLALGRVHFM